MELNYKAFYDVFYVPTVPTRNLTPHRWAPYQVQIFPRGMGWDKGRDTTVRVRRDKTRDGGKQKIRWVGSWWRTCRVTRVSSDPKQADAGPGFVALLSVVPMEREIFVSSFSPLLWDPAASTPVVDKSDVVGPTVGGLRRQVRLVGLACLGWNGVRFIPALLRLRVHHHKATNPRGYLFCGNRRRYKEE